MSKSQNDGSIQDGVENVYIFVRFSLVFYVLDKNKTFIENIFLKIQNGGINQYER
jgi:hypothetical protein